MPPKPVSRDTPMPPLPLARPPLELGMFSSRNSKPAAAEAWEGSCVSDHDVNLIVCFLNPFI